MLEILKALSHENRLRLLNLLKEQELCVCELRNIMGISQSNASRHLGKLRNTNLVKSRQKELWVYYSIAKKTLAEYPFIKELFNELRDLNSCQQDLEHLKKYKTSNVSCEILDESDLFN